MGGAGLLPGFVGGAAVGTFLFTLFHQFHFLSGAVFLILHGFQNLLGACIAQTALLLLLLLLLVLVLVG